MLQREAAIERSTASLGQQSTFSTAPSSDTRTHVQGTAMSSVVGDAYFSPKVAGFSLDDYWHRRLLP